MAEQSPLSHRSKQMGLIVQVKFLRGEIQIYDEETRQIGQNAGADGLLEPGPSPASQPGRFMIKLDASPLRL
jgi:hypothetical protein